MYIVYLCVQLYLKNYFHIENLQNNKSPLVSVLGMGIRIREHRNCLKFTQKPGFLPFKNVLYFEGMFFYLLPTLRKFSCKIKLLVTSKSDQDPDLDPH
jgi:hypothetical protein